MLEPKDVFLGATVTVLAHQFDVHDCDEYTLKYMEANDAVWPASNLALVSRQLQTKKEVLQRMLLTLPGLQTRSATVEEMTALFARCGLQLVKQEVVTVFRAVDPQKTGAAKLSKLLKFVMDL